MGPAKGHLGAPAVKKFGKAGGAIQSGVEAGHEYGLRQVQLFGNAAAS